MHLLLGRLPILGLDVALAPFMVKAVIRPIVSHACSILSWLKIGFPSIRNLKRVSALRLVLWSLIAISSVPLHLLYNSAVFSALSTRQYNVFLVSDDVLDGASFSLSTILPYGGEIDGERVTFSGEGLQAILERYQRNPISLMTLDNQAWVIAYSTNIIPSRADVILVSSTAVEGNSVLVIHKHAENDRLSNSIPVDGYAPYPQQPGIVAILNAWSVNISSKSSEATSQSLPIATPIQYYLSQPVLERCKFQFSLLIMIVVISCNLIKAIYIGFMAWKRDREPLVTLRDAIASFLGQPDPTTEGNCAAGKARFKKSKEWSRYPSQ